MATTPVAERQPTGRRWGRVIAIVLVVMLMLVAIVGYTPILDDDLSSSPDPAADLAAAQAKAADLLAADGADVNPVCRSQVIDHGERTDEVVVPLHGDTNCPAQYTVLAQAHADRG